MSFAVVYNATKNVKHDRHAEGVGEEGKQVGRVGAEWHRCLDGPPFTRDTAAVTGRSVEGLCPARKWRRGHQQSGR
jgi:hypothetical protein